MRFKENNIESTKELICMTFSKEIASKVPFSSSQYEKNGERKWNGKKGGCFGKRKGDVDFMLTAMVVGHVLTKHWLRSTALAPEKKLSY